MKHFLIINLLGESLILSLCLFLGYENQIKIDFFIVSVCLWLIGTLISKNYYINRLPGVLINVINLSKWFAFYFLLLFLFTKLFHEAEFSNLQFFKLFSFIYILLISWRVVIFYLFKKTISLPRNKKNTVIVGVSVNSIHLKKFIDNKPQYGINILGFFSDKLNDKTKESINVIGDYDMVMEYCLKHHVTEIICSIDKVSKDYLNSLIEFSENNLINIQILPDTGGVFGRNFVTTFLEYIPLLALRKNPFDELPNKLIKRLFDIFFSLSVIVFLLSWLFPIISLIIFIDSRGPILFAQNRSGLLNKTFKCLKFRTMIVNSSANIKQAKRNDPRITKVGAFLRKSSLDELPQFFNVLAGSMSVVGPRPHMLKHTEEYSRKVDKYMLRHLVKPGITGLSQILGYRGETQHDLYLMKMRVRMDRFYIENWSFYLDLKVIYATVISVLKKDDKVY